jgi:hypothetical protein
MTKTTTKTLEQRWETGVGTVLNFIGGGLSQSKIGIGLGLLLEGTGDYLTQKGMGVKDVNKKQIAISVGESLAETLVFAGLGKVVGKYGLDFLKAKRGVTARESESVFRNSIDGKSSDVDRGISLRESIPGQERRTMLGVMGDRMEKILKGSITLPF